MRALDLFDYLDTECRTFDEKPLSTLDSAILSQFCMVDGSGVIPAARMRAGGGLKERMADAWHEWRTAPASFQDLFKAELFDGMFRGLTPTRVKHELAALVASPRFRGLELRDYTAVEDEKTHVQFAAMTFVWHGVGSAVAGGRTGGEVGDCDFAYVGFRGTDDSFVGWRENFNMFVEPPVPAQTLAVEYLESVAQHVPERIYVGGHSKGANLATYAAMRCSEATRSRIERVFDHDGPGFRPGFITQADYDLLAGRIDRTVPEEDVVGMFMDCFAPTRVVRSNAHGIMAHSVYTWELDEEKGDDFAYVDSLADSALFVHDVISEWIAGLSDEESPRIVDALFRAIDASGAEGAGQLFSGGAETIGLLMEAARNSDRVTRDILLPELTKLAGIAARRGVASVLGARRGEDEEPED